MTDTPLSDWLVIVEAAQQIGVSTRTVERLARAKRLEQRLRPQAGSPAVAVYNPSDVARLAKERRPAPPPFVLPRGSNGNGRASTESVRPSTETLLALQTGDDPIRQLAAAFRAFLLSPPSPPKDVTVAVMAETTLFLTLTEAVARSGLSRACLLRKIKAGTLDAEKDRGWKIRRKDLEAL